MSAMIEATPVVHPAITPLPKGDSCVLVIFGASGDLTRRKLIPALYDLACIACMHPQFQVLGIGRTNMTSEQFRARMRDAAAASKEAPKEAPRVSPEVLDIAALGGVGRGGRRAKRGSPGPAVTEAPTSAV